MKKFLTLALCLCAVFALGSGFVDSLVKTEPEAVTSLSKKDDTDVRVGGPNEGIHVLSAVAGK